MLTWLVRARKAIHGPQRRGSVPAVDAHGRPRAPRARPRRCGRAGRMSAPCDAGRSHFFWMFTDSRWPGSLDDYRFDDASRAGPLKVDADAADADVGTKRAAGEKRSRVGMAVRVIGGSSPRGPSPSLIEPSAASCGCGLGRLGVPTQAEDGPIRQAGGEGARHQEDPPDQEQRRQEQVMN